MLPKVQGDRKALVAARRPRNPAVDNTEIKGGNTMRIGLCAGLARLAEVQELGFGYLEAHGANKNRHYSKK